MTLLMPSSQTRDTCSSRMLSAFMSTSVSTVEVNRRDCELRLCIEVDDLSNVDVDDFAVSNAEADDLEICKDLELEVSFYNAEMPPFHSTTPQ